MKSGTILEGQQSELSIEAERNILSKQDVMSVDYHTAYHVMGTKWTSASDNPANSALRTGSNYGVTYDICLLYTSPSPRDATLSRMPSSA